MCVCWKDKRDARAWAGEVLQKSLFLGTLHVIFFCGSFEPFDKLAPTHNELLVASSIDTFHALEGA